MNIWIIGMLVLSLVSPIFYTKSMLAGKAKPHRTTRLIIWLAAVAGILGVIDSPNMAGIIFACIFLARATYLLVMSFIYGVGGTSRLDMYCLVVGVLALILYVVTGNGLLAILFGVAADLIGYIPTFVKTWHKPKSEDPTFFIIEGIASLLAIIAIWELRPDILFPAYFVLCSVTVVLLIYRKPLVGWLRRLGSTTTETPE